MPAVSAPVGAFKAAVQAPGLLADATQMAKQMGPELAGLLGLTAFHGSPHRFSKFDASKIGTGEGAQAYGHGLYFAEAPGVAKGYQTALSAERGFSYDGKTGLTRSEVEDMVNAKYGSGYLDGVIRPSGVAGSFIDDMVTGLQRSEGSYPRQYKPGSERAKLYDELRGKITHADPGSFYTVDIPDEMVGKMLDWDKPLSQQSKTIQDIGRSLGLNMDDLGGDLVSAIGAKSPGGAEKLRQAGIPGIRYYDAQSRGGQKATTQNFVVFPGEEEALKMLSVE
jgi:hypothetical protein